METNSNKRPVRRRSTRHNTALENKIAASFSAAASSRAPRATQRLGRRSGPTEREKKIVRETIADETPIIAPGRISLSRTLSRRTNYKAFSLWVVGDTPLITHAWSQKAKTEMLQKQVKATRGGRERRDPEADFVSSLYEMGDGAFGFPAMGLKNCILSVAHKDKGIAKTSVMAALWIDAEIVSARPAYAGAICDMPLLRIYGSEPQNREDMVKIGAGLNKVASLAYRAQFTTWAFRVMGRFNSDVLTEEALYFLIDEAGMACGLGEWRNERKGMFGAFHPASIEEEAAWDAFAAGTGPLPAPRQSMAAE